MANHLTFGWGPKPWSFDVGDADLGGVLVFPNAPFHYICQSWMGWFMGKGLGHSPHLQ